MKKTLIIREQHIYQMKTHLMLSSFFWIREMSVPRTNRSSSLRPEGLQDHPPEELGINIPHSFWFCFQVRVTQELKHIHGEQMSQLQINHQTQCDLLEDLR